TLGSRWPGWPYPSARWTREAERLVELDGKLSAVLRRERRPTDATEAADLADLCLAYRKRPATAVRLYQDAFAADAKLADRLTAHRYNAACAAALASIDQGEEAAALDEKQRAGWRHKALAWLRAELEGLGRLLDKGPDSNRPLIVQQLRHWQADT